MPDALINNLRVRYICAGRGTEPVVLVHGYTTNHAMWWNQVPALARAGYYVIAYDVRGHGETDKPESGYDIATLVKDLEALLDHLEIENAHVAGLSMGGIIGQRFAMGRPKRIRTLIVADSFPGRPDEGTLSIFREHKKLIKKKGLEALFDHLLEHPALPVGPDFQVPMELVEVYKKNFLMNDPAVLERFVAMFHELPDWTDDLVRLEMPVLLMAGDFDEPCLCPMERMHEAIPNSEFRIIPGAGHSSAIEKPEEFNALLLDFLKRFWERI